VGNYFHNVFVVEQPTIFRRELVKNHGCRGWLWF